MEITFSARGTGACPLCRKLDRCPIRNRMKEALSAQGRDRQGPFEIVIYVCPYFVEQA